METLPETAGCYNGTGFPETQHRPVVFWFFSYEPEPIFSVVKCTPRVHANRVNVTVELASNATGIESIGEGITSIGDLEHPAFNGLFFNETMLDQEAVSRLQSVRQQLPSAVFQAAKAKDPLLLQTFVYYGFTNVTADIYVRPHHCGYTGTLGLCSSHVNFLFSTECLPRSDREEYLLRRGEGHNFHSRVEELQTRPLGVSFPLSTLTSSH